MEDWRLIFEDEGTDAWEENWFLDGLKASVTNTPQGMVFSSGPIADGPAMDASHAVLWTRRSFAGDLRVEYDFTRLDSNLDHTSVCILYLLATGTGESPYVSDIYAWRKLREVPAMGIYFQHMNTYHISFACTGGHDKHYIRARHYPAVHGFQKMQIEPSYEDIDLFKPGETWHLCAEKIGRKLSFAVTRGDEMHRWEWDASGFPPITEGRLGLRQMQGRQSRYTNVKVYVPQ